MLINDQLLLREVYRHTAERDKFKSDKKVWQKTRFSELKYGSLFRLDEQDTQVFKVDLKKGNLAELFPNARYRHEGEWYAVREAAGGVWGFKVKGNVPLGIELEWDAFPLSALEVDVITIVPKSVQIREQVWEKAA